jgi:NADPH:quinone reductase-like Zn-dependent oxidoreductase
MTFEQAASIPQAAMLAVQGLIDKGRVQPGQKILLNGAGGGMGTFGLQILEPFGVEVTVVDTAAKLDMLHSLGLCTVLITHIKTSRRPANATT